MQNDVPDHSTLAFEHPPADAAFNDPRTDSLNQDRWTPTQSGNGYGRPDPDEFGLTYLEPHQTEAGLVSDLAPLEITVSEGTGSASPTNPSAQVFELAHPRHDDGPVVSNQIWQEREEGNATDRRHDSINGGPDLAEVCGELLKAMSETRTELVEQTRPATLFADLELYSERAEFDDADATDSSDAGLRLPTPIMPLSAGDSTPSLSRARSPNTEKQYDSRVRMIWRRSVDSRSTDPQQPVVVTPLEVTQDFVASRARVSEATWNLYRAALLCHLVQHRHENDVYEQSYHLLSTVKARSTPGAKTKKARKKTISEEHLNQVIDTLGGMNRHVHWGSRTQFWLQAGLGSGLRPGEWFGASWLDHEKQTILCVPNGKRKTTVPVFTIVSPGQTIHDVEANNPELLTPGSASDETKRIRNVEIEPRDKLWVNLHMGSLNSYLEKVPEHERESRFVTYYNMCRKVLHSACVRTFDGKKQYPLYVMRSQHAANMKAEMPLADVSARMGHEASGKTTKKDYGPRSAAHGGRGAPTPLEKEAKADAQKARVANARSAGVPVVRPRD